MNELYAGLSWRKYGAKQTRATVPNQHCDFQATSRALTDVELKVLSMLDLNNKEIAEELGVRLRTVEKYIEVILAKLQVRNRTAAALKGVNLGLVSFSPCTEKEQAP